MENNDSVTLTKQQENSVGPFRKYVNENLLVVLWNSVLAFGGLLFLIYFWKIQYFPNLDLSSAAAFLAAAAITGLGITVLFALMLVMPGWLHREILSDINRSFFVDKPNGNHKVLLFFVVPMALGAVVFWGISQKWACYIQALPIVSYFILVIFCRGGFKKIANLTLGKKLTLISAPLFNGLIFVVTSWFVVLLLAAQLEQERPVLDETVWQVFVGMTAIVILVNAVIARSGSRLWWLTPAVSVFCLFLLLILSQQLTMIPSAAVRILKLGDFSANVILDQQGSQIAYQFIESAASLVTAAGPEQTKPNKDAVGVLSFTGGCVVRSIKILSRMGTEYYLETQPTKVTSQNTESKKGHITKTRFIIPSAHILSWEAIEKGEETATLLVCKKIESAHKPLLAKMKDDLCRHFTQICPSACCVSQK